MTVSYCRCAENNPSLR